MSDAITAEEPVRPSLAGRGYRLLAFIIDALIGLVVAIPFIVYTGMFDMYRTGQRPDMAMLAMLSACQLVWFFIVNGYLLKTRGQTVGKLLMGIRVSDYESNAVPQFWKLIVRFALPAIVGSVGLIGRLVWLVDVLFICGPERRCVHDLIVGTHVVEAKKS